MTTTAGETAPMFTDEAWEAGWQAAERAGLAQSFQPLMRPINRDDVAAIVSAVVNHGFEEVYIEQQMEEGWARSLKVDAMDSLRSHMLRRLAVEAAEQRCVMLTLPREITDHPEPGITRIRLIVPVRRIGA